MLWAAPFPSLDYRPSQVRGRGDAFYNSPYEPRAEKLAGVAFFEGFPPDELQQKFDWYCSKLAGDFEFGKVEFDLHYEFSNIILEQLIGPVFGMIANSMVDSFCKRAETVYGA